MLSGMWATRLSGRLKRGRVRIESLLVCYYSSLIRADRLCDNRCYASKESWDYDHDDVVDRPKPL